MAGDPELIIELDKLRKDILVIIRRYDEKLHLDERAADIVNEIIDAITNRFERAANAMTKTTP